MSSVIESPTFPLVGVNGKKQRLYSSLSTESAVLEARTRRFLTVGSRLAKRKELFSKRRRVADISLALAILGLVIMIIHNELTFAKVYRGSSVSSNLVKLTISISTLALLGSLGAYQWLDLRLFTINNSMDDWRLALDKRRISYFLLEFLICAIHPIPGDIRVKWKELAANVDPDHDSHRVSVPLDVLLSLPMFLRLYLVCRIIMLHSKLCQDASSQSLGALNRIHFNFRFVFKSLMAVHADYVLAVIMVTLLMVASWTLHLCERYSDGMHGNFLNTMWVVAVTFLTIGYGDIVPNSYCGRSIAVLTGIMGAGCTALVVAVLARKLELSRAEKYVHDFVLDVNLSKQLKHEAANVLKRGWLVYKLTKKGAPAAQILHHQKRMLRAIYNIREIKSGQRRQADNAVTMVDVSRNQTGLAGEVQAVQARQAVMEDKLNHMDHKLSAIYARMCAPKS